MKKLECEHSEIEDGSGEDRKRKRDYIEGTEQRNSKNPSLSMSHRTTHKHTQTHTQ